MTRRNFFVFLALVLCTGCANYPRDVDGTEQHIRNGVMRVGVISNPPWVTGSAGGVSGIEPTLVASLARSMNARVEYRAGVESVLFADLDRRAIDLVIGGLTSKNPYGREVAFTRPFYVDSILVAAAPSSTMPSDYTSGARHVWAVAPGENAWMLTVEKHLHANEHVVPAMVRAVRDSALNR